ncbi:MAG: ribosome recycling factor [Verrucomicrobiota bacterium JB022]|nr:ribosome recycling factor [Verrucomicrobiota bacterium JB022]
MDFEEIQLETLELMEGAVNHTWREFTNIHTGKASPAMVDGLKVDVPAYGTSMAIRDIAAITTPDSRTISIQPWDKSTVSPIEKGIRAASLGLNPVVRGSVIIVPVPELSGERRREMVKVCSGHAEDGRVQVRKARQKAMDSLKKLKTDGGVSEDDIKRHEKEIQEMTDKHIEQINQALKDKEAELLQV